MIRVQAAFPTFMSIPSLEPNNSVEVRVMQQLCSPCEAAVRVENFGATASLGNFEGDAATVKVGNCEGG